MSRISRSFVNVGRKMLTSFNMSHSAYRRSLPFVQPKLSSAVMFQSQRFLSNAPSNKREQELTEFLASEIQLEKESQKSQLPKMSGWSVTHCGSDVTFTRKHNNEEITIKANVCYSVDAVNPESDNGQMVCKPDFAIEIKNGESILGLNCSFIQEEENVEENQNLEDDFQINEISIYEGEFQKSNYAISGDVIDGNLYDLLMSILEDRGIDQGFGKNLIEYCTVYEHDQYVKLLKDLNKFFSK